MHSLGNFKVPKKSSNPPWMIPLSQKIPLPLFNFSSTSKLLLSLSSLKHPDFHDVLLRKMLISHHLTKLTKASDYKIVRRSCKKDPLRFAIQRTSHYSNFRREKKEVNWKLHARENLKSTTAIFCAATAACEKRHENVFFSHSLQKKIVLVVKWETRVTLSMECWWLCFKLTLICVGFWENFSV